MKKKIISLITLMVMIIGSCFSVCADTPTGTSVTLTANIKSSYKISLPATIAFDNPQIGQVASKDYTVGITGNLGTSDYVYCVPDTSAIDKATALGKIGENGSVTSNYSMTDGAGGTASGTIQLDSCLFTHDGRKLTGNKNSVAISSTSKTINGVANVILPRAGDYSGTVVFSYGFDGTSTLVDNNIGAVKE